MLTLNDIDVYCISIDEDKRKHIRNQFKNYKRKLTFIDGIEGYHAYAGAGLAWIRAIHKVIADFEKTEIFLPAMIIEDDVSLTKGALDRPLIIPDNADCLYSGISTASIAKYQDNNQSDVLASETDCYNVVRVYNMLTMHGMMFFSTRYMMACVAALTEAILKTIRGELTVCDLPVARLQAVFNVYAMKEPLVYQDADVGGNEKDTNIILKYRQPSEDEIFEYVKNLPISAKHVIYEPEFNS